MAIKRPLPYMNMTKNFVAAGTVSPGDLVMINTAGKISQSTATDDEYVGIVTYDDRHFANVQRTTFIPGEQASVKLRGTPMRVNGSAAITASHFVKLGATGKVGPEAAGTTKTLNTMGIALETISKAGEITIVPL